MTALLEAVGDLHYQPAVDLILGLLDGEHSTAAAAALKQLAPDQLARRLVAVACDKNANPQARDRALLLLSTAAPGNVIPDLVPLLDDNTVVPGPRIPAGREWRVCDRAAAAIAALLGSTDRIMPMQTAGQRDSQIEQIRQWLKAAY